MLIYVFIGFSLAAIGFITPAMLNMTTVHTSLDRSVRAGISFGIGAASINSIHALIAFSSLQFLDTNPQYILWMQRLGIVVFLILSYVFYKKSKTVAVAKERKDGIHPFFHGLGLSAINMLGLPYYFTSGIALEASREILITSPINYLLAIGVFLGGVFDFSIYAIAANPIAKRSELISKNINIFLAVFFVFFACALAVKVIFFAS